MPIAKPLFPPIVRSRACALLAAVAVAAALCSCSVPVDHAASEPNGERPAASHAAKPAGDEALPALDGEYSYVLATVLSKDAAADRLEVEVVAWEDDRPFSKSDLAAGETGEVLCSELVFFPAGIGDGSTVVVCCLADDAGAFPVTAYAIEKYDLFEERVDRWLAV